MSRIISKKRALLTAAIASLALVAVAVAYYTTLGDGSGTGTTDAAYAENLDITGDVPAGLVPGDEVTISGNVHNPNPGSAEVTTVTGAVNAAPAGCDDTYFDIEDIVMNEVIPAGGNADFTATLTMEDDPAENQNACKSAGLTVTWASGL
jgi:hypothetical protein